jgi:hypothetical protein
MKDTQEEAFHFEAHQGERENGEGITLACGGCGCCCCCCCCVHSFGGLVGGIYGSIRLVQQENYTPAHRQMLWVYWVLFVVLATLPLLYSLSSSGFSAAEPLILLLVLPGFQTSLAFVLMFFIFLNPFQNSEAKWDRLAVLTKLSIYTILGTVIGGVLFGLGMFVLQNNGGGFSF